ncbi:hypothetical protein ACTXT7_004661 [Hymenolepis weldensis]
MSRRQCLNVIVSIRLGIFVQTCTYTTGPAENIIIEILSLVIISNHWVLTDNSITPRKTPKKVQGGSSAKRNTPSSEAAKTLKDTYGNDVVNEKTCRKWFSAGGFKKDDFSLKNERRTESRMLKKVNSEQL